ASAHPSRAPASPAGNALPPPPPPPPRPRARAPPPKGKQINILIKSRLVMKVWVPEKRFQDHFMSCSESPMASILVSQFSGTSSKLVIPVRTDCK
ncbi:MAG: hypothetical protein OXF20_01110, partial [Gammaproteobacteria bacterium]|nr:hypothetical protein [Gammaproteobacteria bacterium]